MIKKKKKRKNSARYTKGLSAAWQDKCFETTDPPWPVYCSQKVATAVSSPRPGVPTAREAVRTSCSHGDSERNRGGVALRNGLAPDCTPMTPRGDLQRDRSSSGLDERKHKVTVVATKF